VNIGVRALKPTHGLAHLDSEEITTHTSNRKLWATSGKLQEISALGQSQFAHSLKQILYAFTVHIEAVVCLDRVH
jgi:hypothetical protein